MTPTWGRRTQDWMDEPPSFENRESGIGNRPPRQKRRRPGLGSPATTGRTRRIPGAVASGESTALLDLGPLHVLQERRARREVVERHVVEHGGRQEDGPGVRALDPELHRVLEPAGLAQRDRLSRRVLDLGEGVVVV